MSAIVIRQFLRLVVTVPLALAVFVDSPGLAAGASLHRMSNGKIAFLSGFGDRSLDVINPDGSGLRRLTRCMTRGCEVSDAVWSPDGRHIAFLRGGTSLYRDESVYLIDAKGGGERRVAPCGPSYIKCWRRALAWSPDGARLAIARGGSLYVLDLKTRRTRRLTARVAGAALDPDWSPDGSRIAFALATGCGSVCPIQPYIVNVDGRGLRRLSTFYGDLGFGGHAGHRTAARSRFAPPGGESMC